MHPKKYTLDIFTPMRGVMMIYIILFHLATHISILQNNFFISKGYIAVEFFFLLSSFVFLYQNHDNNLLTIKGYFSFQKKFFLRIYPIYIILMLFFLICVHKGEYHSTATLLVNLTLTQEWISSDNTGYIEFAWYLSAQFFLYLMMPFWGFMYNYSKLLICLLALCFFIIFGYITFINPNLANEYNSINHTTKYALTRAATSMFFGGVSFWIYQILIHKNIKKNSIFIISILCFIGYLSVQYLNPMLIPDVIIIPIFASMMIGLLFITDSIKALFMQKWLIFIGNISLPLLLVHEFSILILINFFNYKNFNLIENIIAVISVFAISIIYAYMLDKHINKPIQKYFK
jgi:peptidoglycan/LPS O-acetylase OafA/YrhL